MSTETDWFYNLDCIINHCEDLKKLGIPPELKRGIINSIKHKLNTIENLWGNLEKSNEIPSLCHFSLNGESFKSKLAAVKKIREVVKCTLGGAIAIYTNHPHKIVIKEDGLFCEDCGFWI
jgi:hypothetical protein